MTELRFGDNKWNHVFHCEVGSSGSLDDGRDDRFIGMWERVEENHGFEIIWQGKTSSRHLVEDVYEIIDLIREIFHVMTAIFARVDNVVFDGFRKTIKLSSYTGRSIKLS